MHSRSLARSTSNRVTTQFPLASLLAFLAILVTGVFDPGSAQAAHGQLIDADTRNPVEGALVALIGADGTVQDQRLTNADGRFLLRGQGAGRFTLRAERIGFRSVSSGPFRLAAGQLLRIDLETGRNAIQLDGITVHGEQRCVVRPGEGLEIARVWEEARKALAMQRWTEQEGSYWFKVQNYSRDLDRDARRVLAESRNTRAGLSQNPIGSLPAEDLMTEGFIQRNPDESLQYYGPDASTLLSDIFLDRHCFQLETNEDEPDLLGLAFEPVERRDIPDIQGTLWLERSSSALQFLEYRYTWAPHPDARRLARGRVDFEELPNGAWIVRKWWIQMPQIGREEARFDRRERPGIGVVGIRETGGEIVGIRTQDQQEVSRAERGLVAGLVWDSTRAAPLGGAKVYLLGTSYAGTSNAEGQFLIDGVPEGVFRATFTHPRLDTLATLGTGMEVEVAPGKASEIRLAVPSIASIISEVCADRSREDASGVIRGRVLDTETGRPVPEASVSLTWQVVSRPSGWLRGDDMIIETTTDDHGRFTVCNTPAQELIEIQAKTDEGRSDILRFQIERDSYTTIGLEVNPDAGVSVSERGVAAPGDVGVRTVRGQVLDSVAGTPVSFARVTLVDEDEQQVALTVSDVQGRFRLQASEPGRYRLTIQAEFYEEGSHGPITLTDEEGLALTVELNPLPVELRGFVVDVERQSPRLALEGVYDRMTHGFGNYFDREKIDARPGRPVIDLIAQLPMVGFFPDTLGGGEGVFFRHRQFQRLIIPQEKVPICFPQVYLNGALFAPGGEFPSRLDRVFLDDLEAIEVYESPAFLPGRFNGINSKCGTIVLWTRGEEEAWSQEVPSE